MLEYAAVFAWLGLAGDIWSRLLYVVDISNIRWQQGLYFIQQGSFRKSLLQNIREGFTNSFGSNRHSWCFQILRSWLIKVPILCGQKVPDGKMRNFLFGQLSTKRTVVLWHWGSIISWLAANVEANSKPCEMVTESSFSVVVKPSPDQSHMEVECLPPRMFTSGNQP